MSKTDELRELAERMAEAYARFSKEYAERIAPVEQAITKIKVRFTSKIKLPGVEDGVTLGVDRISGTWRLTANASGCVPLVMSEASVGVKVAAVATIDDFVREYIEHVKIARARILIEAERAEGCRFE